MVPSDFKALIQRFYHLQSERVETYQLFDEGHEAYLRTGPHYDFDHYKQLVHEITQAFCGISKEMLEIKEKLHHQFDRPALSEHIEKLQSKEKHKLELSQCLTTRRQTSRTKTFHELPLALGTGFSGCHVKYAGLLHTLAAQVIRV
uniref:Required for excision 1-B domain containing n=1 Tax=Gasterosteus aculeatus aculeatus TaxID=481459 RepID=G3PFZ1_GASAC